MQRRGPVDAERDDLLDVARAARSRDHHEVAREPSGRAQRAQQRRGGRDETVGRQHAQVDRRQQARRAPTRDVGLLHDRAGRGDARCRAGDAEVGVRRRSRSKVARPSRRALRARARPPPLPVRPTRTARRTSCCMTSSARRSSGTVRPATRCTVALTAVAARSNDPMRSSGSRWRECTSGTAAGRGGSGWAGFAGAGVANRRRRRARKTRRSPVSRSQGPSHAPVAPALVERARGRLGRVPTRGPTGEPRCVRREAGQAAARCSSPSPTLGNAWAATTRLPKPSSAARSARVARRGPASSQREQQVLQRDAHRAGIHAGAAQRRRVRAARRPRGARPRAAG